MWQYMNGMWNSHGYAQKFFYALLNAHLCSKTAVLTNKCWPLWIDIYLHELWILCMWCWLLCMSIVVSFCVSVVVKLCCHGSSTEVHSSHAQLIGIFWNSVAHPFPHLILVVLDYWDYWRLFSSTKNSLQRRSTFRIKIMDTSLTLETCVHTLWLDY